MTLAAAGTLALAGCGDDESEDSSTTSTTAGAAELTVEVTPPQAAPGDTIRAVAVNETDEEFTYGAAYELEREVNGSFEPVKLPPRAVPQIAYVAPPGDSGPPVEIDIPGDFGPGTYRVVIARDVPGVGDLVGEFEVIDG